MNDSTPIPYPRHRGISGIYEIYCIANGKRYVGSAQCLCHRRNDHRSYLNRGIHPNIHLQRAWSLYGETAFEWCVLELCPIEDLLEREQHYLDTLHPELNISVDSSAPMKGRKKSAESVERGASKIRGRKQTQEHIQKRHEPLKGRKRTDKERRNISEGTKAKTPRGEKNGFAKLTAADVIEIRRLRATGMTLMAIGKMFSISHKHVGEIVSGKCWSHIPMPSNETRPSEIVQLTLPDFTT